MSISKWYPWYISSQNKGGKVIRRYRKVDGKIKWETYPKSKYKHMNVEEVEALLRRLNATYEAEKLRAQRRFDLDNSYINSSTIEDFESFLSTRASSPEHIKTLIATIHDYTIAFFIHKQKLPNPDQWKSAESAFGKFLLSKDLSAGYIKRIIQTANRLIEFLHNKYPEEIRLVKLDPVGGNVLKHKQSAKEERYKYISESDLNKILKACDKSIVPLVKLSYFFGLRRAETLGLKLENVYEDVLHVDRQLVKLGDIPNYSTLKNKEKRDIPFWFTTPEDTYELISSIELMHPDTISDRFEKAVSELGLSFQFHDLRRTFITNALRKYHFLDVRLAAGHSDLETTQKYIQDDRQIQRRKFKPKIKLVSS